MTNSMEKFVIIQKGGKGKYKTMGGKSSDKSYLLLKLLSFNKSQAITSQYHRLCNRQKSVNFKTKAL